MMADASIQPPTTSTVTALENDADIDGVCDEDEIEGIETLACIMS